MKLFALQSSTGFGQLIADHLRIALSKTEDIRFEDGEYKIRSLENVNRQNVYVVHSLYSEPSASVNDKLNRLLFFIASLKDAGAVMVTAVVPFLAYSRKDRKTKANDPVMTRYVAQLFEACRTDKIITMDVHNVQAFHNAFRCGAENLEGISIFSEKISDNYQDEKIVVVSPDLGGMKRAERFQRILKNSLRITPELSVMQKYRTGSDIHGDEAIPADVSNKVVIIVDDLISTGKTIARAAEVCGKAGAKKVIAFVTHGLFAENPDRYLNINALDEIYISNSVASHNLKNSQTEKKVKELDVSKIFAEAIKKIDTGDNYTDLIYT